MQIKQPITVVFILALSLTMVGCANVPAWERGTLAKSQMALDPHPLQSNLQMHNYGSREAAASTHSSQGGGGCGCY